MDARRFAIVSTALPASVPTFAVLAVAPVLGATRNLQVDILIAAAVRRDEGYDQLSPAVRIVRIAHADLAQAPGQSLEVGCQAEWLSVIDGDHFVNPVAENKAAVKYGYACLAQRHVLAIQINDFAHCYLTGG